MPDQLIDILVGAAMFGLMFGMGLTLTRDDFHRIAGNPRATIVGTALQLMLMPLIALGLARAFALPPMLTAGLVIVGACPGGMFSNMYVHFARAHTALSITLTATATLVTLFTLPLWVRFAVASTPGADASIEMPVLDTAFQLGLLTVLPIGIGMATRSRRPDWLRFERPLSIVSAIVIALGVGIEASSRPDPPVDLFMQSLIPAALFAVAAIVVGTVLPTLFRLRSADTVTIAVELVVKNTLLGIVLVSQTLGFEAMIPILAFTIFQTPGGLALLVGWRLLQKWGYLEASSTFAGDAPAKASALEPNA